MIFIAPKSVVISPGCHQGSQLTAAPLTRVDSTFSTNPNIIITNHSCCTKSYQVIVGNLNKLV